MKLKNILYICMMALIALTSCEKEPVVLEFDDSYTPKAPDKGDRDPLPPVDLLTLYTYFVDNQPETTIKRTIDSDDGSLSMNNINDQEITIRTSIPTDVDTKIDFFPMTDENSDGEYSTIVKGINLELPADAYSLSTQSVTIPQGEKLVKISIQFNKDKFLALDNTKVYIIPLVMKADNKEAIVVNNYALHINLLDVYNLPNGNNVEALSNISGNKVNRSNISFISDFAKDHLHKLNDGDTWSANWWINGLSDNYLQINWNSGSSKVKAIRFVTMDYYSNGLKSVKVWASQDGGATFVEQGIVEWAPSVSYSVCAFKTPITVNAFKFTNFVSNTKDGSSSINIYEVDLYEEDE